MSELEAGSPAHRFAEDMAAAGAPVTVEDARLLYDVMAVGGALAGCTVTTGVSRSEVAAWPLSPPHWMHLPDDVEFAQTNSDTTDCPPGWRRHSRDFNFTDMSMKPAAAWLRHVRGFVSSATAPAA